MIAATNAIRSGTGGPPSLEKFALEKALWQHLGLHWDDLAGRPWREVEDYVLYLQLITREEQAAQQQGQAGRASGRG